MLSAAYGSQSGLQTQSTSFIFRHLKSDILVISSTSWATSSSLSWMLLELPFSSHAAPKEVNSSLTPTCCLMQMTEGLKYLRATYIINYKS